MGTPACSPPYARVTQGQGETQVLCSSLENLVNAPSLSVDIAKTATDIIEKLQQNCPSISALLHSVIDIAILVALVLGLLACLPVVLKCFCKQTLQLATDIKLLQLKNDAQWISTHVV